MDNQHSRGNMVNMGGGYNQYQHPQYQPQQQQGQQTQWGQPQVANPYSYQAPQYQQQQYMEGPMVPTQEYLDNQQRLYQEEFMRRYSQPQQQQPNYNNMYNTQFNPYAQAQAQKQQAIESYNKAVEQANINKMLFRATQKAKGVRMSDAEIDRMFEVNINSYIQTPNTYQPPVYDPEDAMIQRARMIEDNHQKGNTMLDLVKKQGFTGTPMLEHYPQNMSHEDFCNSQTQYIEYNMKTEMAKQNKSSNCYNRDNYRNYMNGYANRFDNNTSMDDNSIPSYYKINNQEYDRRRSAFIDSIKGGAV